MNLYAHKLIGKKKPLIAMLHLAGENSREKEIRAVHEAEMFEEEGVDAVIVENYHGNDWDVARTLELLKGRKLNLLVGVNMLPNDFTRAFMLARRHRLAMPGMFIQLDYVAGKYKGTEDFDALNKYDQERAKSNGAAVLGGVWPKYYTPIAGSNLEMDIVEGMRRADALVVTGAGTGKETPLDKINNFRRVLGGFPFYIGAGLNHSNAYEQMRIADGAIVGRCLKRDNQTQNEAERSRVRDLVSIFREVRKIETRQKPASEDPIIVQ